MIAERFIRTLKIRFLNTRFHFQKNAYNDKLDNIINKYNNTYRSTVKIKPFDVKSNTYIDSSK